MKFIRILSNRLISTSLFICITLTGSVHALDLSATGYITTVYSTCTSSMDGVIPGFTVTIQNQKIAISHPDIAFGRPDTQGLPLEGNIIDGAVSASFFETPDIADPVCPTCTWTMNFTGLIDSPRRAIVGTLTKTPAGGECQTMSQFELIAD